MDTFDTFKQFKAVTLYFAGKFDYIKYQGKLNLPWKAFEKYKGKQQLHKLGKTYKEDFNTYIAVHCASGNASTWVGDFMDDEVWVKHQRYVQAAEYSFKQEMEELLEYDFKEMMVSKEELPLLIKRRIQGLTSIETCAILDSIFSYINKNHKCLHPLWKEESSRIEKLKTFMNLPPKRFARILKGIIHEKA
jgi:hypothetical protein